MADAVADAALRDFLAKREGRRERSPIRAAESAAQNVHHNRESVAFVSAAFAVGTERQERAAVDHIVRIGCGSPLALDGPAPGDWLAQPARGFGFFLSGGAGGPVDHDRGLP